MGGGLIGQYGFFFVFFLIFQEATSRHFLFPFILVNLFGTFIFGVFSCNPVEESCG